MDKAQKHCISIFVVSVARWILASMQCMNSAFSQGVPMGTPLRRKHPIFGPAFFIVVFLIGIFLGKSSYLETPLHAHFML